MNFVSMIENLRKTCDDMHCGFHFEEGGCWAMAAAIAEVLEADGHPSTFFVTTQPHTHCYAVHGGSYYDYTGQCDKEGEGILCDKSDMLELMCKAGWTLEDFYAELDFAREVVAEAASR